MTQPARPTLVLIDGHAVAYRHFFALPQEKFTLRDGTPTNATFGFARVLLDVLEKDAPHYLAVAFDMGLSGRDEIYNEYKGTRSKMPDELRSQMADIRALVEAFNIPILEFPGYEADDVLGTLARQAEAQGLDVLIVTGDRDLLQLVTEHTRVRLPKSRDADEDRLFDLLTFREKYDGLEPPQLVDLKAFMGDSSDNIPGVHGIGEKGAIRLLRTYGSVAGVYEHLDDLRGSLREKLEAGRDSAFMSRQLAQIRRDVPVTLDLSACVAQDFDRDAVAELFRRLEFRSLIRRLPHFETPSTPATQLSMFGDETSPAAQPAAIAPHFDTPVHEVVRTITVQNESALAALVERLNHAEAIAFDTEGTSLDQMRARLVGISLAVGPEEGYYVPVGHAPAPGQEQDALLDETRQRQLPLETVIAALRPPLTDPAIPKYAHNGAFDLVMLRRHGIDVAPIRFDTMIAEWVLDPDSHNKGLKNLAWHRLGVEMTHIEELIGKGKHEITIDRVPIERVAPYAAADAVMTYRLVDVLRPELVSNRLIDLYEQLEIPLIPVLADMEMAGILLDVDFLSEMSIALAVRLETLEEEIYDLSGGYGRFNINSPKQLNDVLFGKLQLPAAGVRKTTHGFSTGADVLEDLRDKHPIVEKILEHRELTKLKGTYVDALPALINPDTGRLHTRFNQTGTVTGRLSSDNPNLQNIPVRTDTGREIRKAFIAPPGAVLLSVDYSQVELRVLAHVSQDPTLLAAFREGQDIHRATAAAVYGIPLDQVTYEQRHFAKRVNFGLMYGMGAYRLSRDSGLPLAQAEEFIRAYFEQFPRVRAYFDSVKEMARTRGYLETLLGRRRDFSILKRTSGDRASTLLRQRVERQAINMPIQGTAADIIKLAMINLHRRLRDEGHQARMLLQVHDELVLEVAAEELLPVATLVRETMENAFPLDAPLRADAKYGPNWLEVTTL